MKRVWLFTIALSLASVVLGFYLTGNFIHVYNNGEADNKAAHDKQKQNYNKRLGILSFIGYVILSIYCVVAYKLLINVLKKHFHEELKKER